MSGQSKSQPPPVFARIVQRSTGPQCVQTAIGLVSPPNDAASNARGLLSSSEVGNDCRFDMCSCYLYIYIQSGVPILYKVKVLNPIRRKKATTRQLHDFTGRFTTVLQVKQQIIKELGDILPSSSPDLLEVGYYEGRQSMKIGVASSKDLDAMYRKISKNSEVFLWAENLPDELDNDSDAEREKKRRKTTELSTNKRQDKEEEIDEIYEELRSHHKDNFSVPQLRLWARMIYCGTYDDYIEPPRVPMITGSHSQRPKKESAVMVEAFTGAAEAIAKVFSPQPATSSVPSIGISPSKSTDLRMKNLQQLRLLHQLFEENVLTEKELTEQKTLILEALHKL